MPATILTAEELRRISKGFGMQVTSVAPVRKVLRAETPRGPIMIKALAGSETEARFLESALRYIRSHGLEEVPLYLSGKGGRPFVRSGRVVFVTMPWFDGRECSFRDSADARDAAGLLGRFHTAARRFPPPPELPRSRAVPGRWVQKLLSRSGQVASFSRQALERPASFPREVIEVCRRAQTRARWVADALRGPACESLTLKAALESTLAHGDYSQINVIRRNDGSLSVVDWDGLSYEIQLKDLFKMLRQCEWNIDVAAQAIDAYRDHAEFGRDALELLAEALAFPKLFWLWTRSVHRDPALVWNKESLTSVAANLEKQDEFLTAFSLHIAPLPRFKEGFW